LIRAAVPHVVVVGAGFGGLTVARELADAARHHPLRVTLVDRHNHHTFQPLLYQVATSGLQPQDVGHPLRPIFGLRRRGRRRDTAVDVRLGEVVGVDRPRHEVVLDDGTRLAYDRLVVAAGAVTSDFGLPGVAEHGFGLKSLPEALTLRDHVLRQFEHAAVRDGDDAGALTFVIAGGGPTGVELAGAIAELVDDVLRRDHPTLDFRRVRVVLVEMADRLLGGFHERSGQYALAALRRRGVEVRLGAALARAAADHVELDDGTVIPTRTLVWVAGVAAAPLGQQLDTALTRGGRVVVGPTLQLPDDPDVYVLGDVAGATDADGRLLPQLAPVALQQGRYVADHLVRTLDGLAPSRPFRYVDKGTMATIGRHDAVAELPFGIRYGGVLAWVSWLALHLLFLVGFRNRVAVFLSWVWNYLTYDRAARLILHADRGRTRDEIPEPDPTGHA
jgi:NADH dehydrogenase